jgi:YVTN family beta-propeller protein
VSNQAGTTIQAINPATNKVVQVIRNIELPETARTSPDGSRLYVTNWGDEALFVLDRQTGKQIKKVPLSGHANDLAVSKDGKMVLVCIRQIGGKRDGLGALDIIDATSLQKIKSIPTKRWGLHDILVTQDGKYAVVDSPEGQSVTVYDIQKQEAAWEAHIEDREALVFGVENNPDGSGRRIFINLSGFHGFAVIDFATHKEVARIRLPDEPALFPMRPRSNPCHGIGVAPDNKTLWVTSRPANAVFVYSLPDLKLLGHVPLPELKLPGHAPIGAIPHWVDFTPDSKTAYISNATVKSVSAIDVKTLKEVARIPVGEGPLRIYMGALP